MRLLVINADDFGLASGINKGILKAHQKGVVTSTSLMVYGSCANEVRKLLAYPKMSVGLHFQLSVEGRIGVVIRKFVLPKLGTWLIKFEFERQLKRFVHLVGRYPDHLDSHHNTHLTYPKIGCVFKEYADKLKIPVRGVKEFNSIDSFYGQNNKGLARLARINSAALIKILSGIKEGVNDITCHPAVYDDTLAKTTSYAAEREFELNTLTNPKIKNYLAKKNIKLVSWKEITEVLANKKIMARQ